MANALYPSAKELLLTGGLNWMSDDIRIALVRGYNFTLTHDYLNDVTGSGGEIVATSGALTGKSVTLGVVDADDVTLGSVPSGAACSAVIVYKEGANNASRALIAFFDTGIGLPVTPNGLDVDVVWDQGSNRIFRI